MTEVADHVAGDEPCLCTHLLDEHSDELVCILCTCERYEPAFTMEREQDDKDLPPER